MRGLSTFRTIQLLSLLWMACLTPSPGLNNLLIEIAYTFCHALSYFHFYFLFYKYNFFSFNCYYYFNSNSPPLSLWPLSSNASSPYALSHCRSAGQKSSTPRGPSLQCGAPHGGNQPLRAHPIGPQT